jgi:NADP-dependent 3-hydroxy acid dehydrogenase YdfG
MQPIAILTGASSGIGAAAAEQFLEAQYTVINLSRRECPIPEVTTLTTDLSDTQSLANSCKALCEIVTARGVPSICLVHNASLMLKDRCDTTDDESMLQALSVNVLGINTLNRALLPLFPFDIQRACMSARPYPKKQWLAPTAILSASMHS